MLDERKKRVLQAIVEAYIQTAEPVSSNAIMNLEGLPTDFFPHMTKSPQKRLPAQSENLICLKKTIYADGKHFSPKTLK